MLQTWTDDRVEELKKLYASGITCSGIAYEMGLTRNAVIGKINRLGLSSPKVAKFPARLAAPRKSRANAGPQVQAINARRDGTAAAPTPFVARAAEVDPLHVDLLELTSDMCRWPFGSGPFTFCGCEKIDGSAYCGPHDLLSKPVRLNGDGAPPATRGSEEHRQRMVDAQRRRRERERAA